MNKKEILDKIKSLEGLNNDEKAFLINLVNTKKKYGLVWEDKPEDVEEELRTKLPVLKEVKERAIINDTETEHYPNHILIEGDNLHALTALTFTHEGKIDLIYIDPPYNTGKKDFVYNDTYVDKEDAFRHSKWISFMHKRLNLAKRLLSHTGVIFVSIDDNESSQLKILLDEVFNESNFIAELIHKNNSNKNQAKLFGISTEYMYCYAKDKLALKGIEWKVSKKGAKDIALVFSKLKKQGLDLEEIEKEIKLLYQRPKYSHLSRWNKVNNKGVFKDADLSREGGPKDYTIINPNTGNPCMIPNRGWGKSHDELLRLQNEDLIWYGSDDTPPGLIDYITTEDLTVPDSFFYFDNSIDTKWQKSAFGKIVFENPKPLEMIQMILEIQTRKDIKILDFFAGSGTTLHAAININETDGGNRQCIIVTNNENNICEEVTYARAQKVINGYENIKGEKVDGISKNNLRYYQCNFVDREPSITNKRQLTILATELLCIKEDCYKEITSELASKNWHKLFTGANGNYVYVIYDDGFIEEAVELLKAFITQNPEAQIKVYVFSNGQYAYAEEFEDVAKNIKLAALPDAIYKAYQYILPKQNKEFIPELEEETPVEFDNEIEA